MAKELSDFSKTNSDVALQQNGKTKNFQSFFRKGILRIKGENCLDQQNHTQKYTTKPSFTVGETNLGVNMNPNLGSNSLPSSGQVTPSTGKVLTLSLSLLLFSLPLKMSIKNGW